VDDDALRVDDELAVLNGRIATLELTVVWLLDVLADRELISVSKLAEALDVVLVRGER
jgi:hypothetical protein